ncbi:NADH-quinone oxidoreductase subunit H [Modestobacter altitudinis]|uniref:NADH-quinone oxidoreductase subunit H n=1 Tax=Modestobacter altitudinis TaxID=2213158 RepID=UPI001FECE9F1|nr:NADH-quinone oxidoreductase subunit H [Modestobacter altitudinis]
MPELAADVGTLASTWGVLPAALVVAAVGVLLGVLVSAADRAVVTGQGVRAGVEPLRSGMQLLLEQRRRTLAPDRLLWRVGGAAVPVVALLSMAVVPLAGRTLWSTSADLVWFNAMEALLWAAVWLMGWGPNAVHSLTGGYRFLAQGLAYELPLMFSLITVGVAAGSLRSTDVVAAQDGLWFVVTMPVAFVVFVGGAAAFAFWGPFAAPTGADIAGGVTSELSGLDRLLLLAGRAVFLGATAAMAAALFLGGDAGPWLPGPVWHLLKTVAVVAGLVWGGRRLPLLRPDRVVELAWVVLVPLTLLQALVVAVLAVSGFYA